MELKKFKEGKRSLYHSFLAEKSDAIPPAPFAVLLPAYSEQEVSTAAEMTPTLLESGCIEFCCIGSSAEKLHDLIDEIIEDRDMFSIVTTFHSDVEDACDYFLLAAGGGTPSLWAFTAQHPPIAKRLMALIDDAATNV
ncbi:hypothetical protein [Pseudoduganella armeniaca]|uniref:Uncharacterized protein n=1 Tax=Pseudoduganella armeniaca TaxID=2072590 RepID=A0A2R4C6E1_9BURK|nr:hypothetical protein [Pseudoduganella armeniaca]AVR95108.1 hypothetical protein C9I28_04760 [Pseudoduganella armeniaca]